MRVGCGGWSNATGWLFKRASAWTGAYAGAGQESEVWQAQCHEIGLRELTPEGERHNGIVSGNEKGEHRSMCDDEQVAVAIRGLRHHAFHRRGKAFESLCSRFGAEDEFFLVIEEAAYCGFEFVAVEIGRCGPVMLIEAAVHSGW